MSPAPPIFYRLFLVACLLLGACASERAPISDGRTAVRPVGRATLPEAEPGHYRVKAGDTLYRIALEHGQSYRDIARWNNLANPDQIEIDQLLLVVPPDPGPRVVSAPIQQGPVLVKPLDGPGSAKVDATPEPRKNDHVSDMVFSWPAKGTLVKFHEIKNKGLDIIGQRGDPVSAAGPGKVVYAGRGLRGYGHLLIVKHSSVYLTAYAHNEELLVKEGDQVETGQLIARMGQSDADRVKLHFEVRRHGKPMDPLLYLPPVAQ
jgi:lipoprotein NlpD